MLRYRKIIILLALLLTAAAYFLFNNKVVNLETITPTRGKAIQAVYATGTVEATVMIPVAPRQTARLMNLYADEGHPVTKGMVMAQLEDEDLKNALAERKSALDLAEKEFDRQTRLSKTGAISKQAYDKANANLESAKANVAQAEANLNFMRMIAPEDGVVIRREGEIGEMIPANQPVLWMSCCAGLRVAAEVDEEDISLVKIGQDVVIRADAFPEDIFKGKVQSITPKGDPIARSYRVRVTLDENSKLMIGMTAETNIIIAEHENGLLIPATALKDGHVFVRKGRNFEKVPVKTGAKSGEKIEIIEGITEQDEIIADANSLERK